MSDRVPKLDESPAFNARTYSDRLQETRIATGPLGPVAVFDKTKPDSIVGFTEWAKGKVRDTINALTEFTAAHEVKLEAHTTRLNAQDARLDVLEAARPPFGSGSG